MLSERKRAAEATICLRSAEQHHVVTRALAVVGTVVSMRRPHVTTRRIDTPQRLFYTRTGQKQRHAPAAHDAALRIHDR